MEKLFSIDTQNGITGLLASVCVLMSFQFLLKLGEFIWKLKKEKDQLSEQGVAKLAQSMESNTAAIQHLESQLKSLQSTMAEIPKVKIDMKRLFSAVKALAGDEWPRIRKEIIDEHEF